MDTPFAIASFLFAYPGYGSLDERIGKLAAASARGWSVGGAGRFTRAEGAPGTGVPRASLAP